MSKKKKKSNPNARGALDRLKMETANEVGIEQNEHTNADILSKDAERLGGNRVKKMVEFYGNGASGIGYR